MLGNMKKLVERLALVLLCAAVMCLTGCGDTVVFLPEEPVEDLSKHSLAKCKQRLEETITAKIKQVPFNVLCERIGRSEDEVRSMLGYYKILARLEHDVNGVQV